MSGPGAYRPTRDNLSFHVARPLTLSYDENETGYTIKTQGVGAVIWHKRATGGRMYFIDMDGHLGSVPGERWQELREAGLIHLTPDWVSWEGAIDHVDLCHAQKYDSDNGDALGRLKKEE